MSSPPRRNIVLCILGLLCLGADICEQGDNYPTGSSEEWCGAHVDTTRRCTAVIKSCCDDGPYQVDDDLAGGPPGPAPPQCTVSQAPNLAKCDLRGLNLTEWPLAGANLAEANLAEANLAGMDLRETDFSHANLSKANCTGANLGGAVLAYANLNETVLIGADLTGADLNSADMRGARLSFPDDGDAGTDADAGVGNGATLVIGVIWCATICPDATDSRSNGGEEPCGTCEGHLRL